MRSFMRRLLAGVVGLVAVTGMVTLVAAGSAGASVSSAAPNPAHLAGNPQWSTALRWPFVRPGNVGERVVAVQYLLQNQGYQVRADGIYGPATTRAVRRFQRAHGLNPSGNVGASSWNRLIVTLRRGSRGPAVRALQHNLKWAYGFRYVQVSGYFGQETRAAVLFLQAHSHLRADGVVGKNTWKTIIVFEQ